jgi:hypothetical protein
MKRARGLVGHFSHSSQALAKLKEIQKFHDLLVIAVGVIQDIITRWWSTHAMLE